MIQKNRTGTLSTLNNQYILAKNEEKEKVYSLGHDIRSSKLTDDEITDPLTATDYKDPIKVAVPKNCLTPCDIQTQEGVSGTLSSGNEKSGLITQNVLVTYGVDSYNQTSELEKMETLRTPNGGDNLPKVCTYQKTTGSLCASGYEKLGTQEAPNDMYVTSNYCVRRLTPLECERLQGYPDGWTDIGDWTDSKGRLHKGESDSPRYKALGNSIALPFWEWMADRMVNVLKKDGVYNPTMASLFDGIGGFPLVYSRCGCEPVWASEIEEFPIAVTKIRFPDDEVTNDRR